MVIGKCAETTTSGDTHLAYVVRVVSGDGATIRGVIGLYHATSTEFPLMASAATRIHNARTNGATAFSSQAGDRIIIEIGLHGVTPAAELIQMRIGDPSATEDFALTAGLTTDLDPWVQLSRDVEFGTPPEEHSGSAAISGNGSVAGVTQKGGRASTLTSGKGTLVALAIAGMLGLAGISGGGTQAAIGQKAAFADAAISAGGSLTATGTKFEGEQHSGTALISGNGVISSIGDKVAKGPAIISENGSILTAGIKASSNVGVISGGGLFALSGNKDAKASMTISGAGSALAGGEKSAFGQILISGTGHIWSEDPPIIYYFTVKEDLEVEEAKLTSAKTYSGGVDIIVRILRKVWATISKVSTVWQETKK
jgi:hypothetical protein